jgi:hypothetical protein
VRKRSECSLSRRIVCSARWQTARLRLPAGDPCGTRRTEAPVRSNKIRHKGIVNIEQNKTQRYREHRKVKHGCHGLPTQDGLAHYGFSIEFHSDIGWRVYITLRPFDRNHDDTLRLPYQAVDNNGRCYVSWPSKLDSLGDAKTVAALWAELIYQQQRTEERRRGSNAIIKGPNAVKRMRSDAA